MYQESATVAKGDWSGAAALQERTAPLVDFLAANSAGAGDAVLRARIATLHQRRNETSVALGREMERTRGELQQAKVAKRRVTQIAPAYRGPAAGQQRLRGIG